jgi:SAM-dependent methyltransferase
MEDYRPETYGERIAGVYDELHADCDPAAITALNQLADGGRALELGIGTGRIALPLKQSGIEVSGIDASESMVARLHAKPGAEAIQVTSGNFADVPVEGKYALIYVLFNTFYALLTQDDQVRCMTNDARHLEPQGVFVIEAFFPDLSRFTGQQAVRAVNIEQDRGQLDVSEHDPVRQRITSQHMIFAESGLRLYPVEIRYVWPAELDLMARLAGLVLKKRWGDWRGGEFTAASAKHISVYGRP